MRFRSRLLFLLTVVLAAVAFHAPTSAAGDFFVGVDEDSARWGRTDLTASIMRGLGLKAIRIRLPWQAGQSRVSERDQQLLQRAIVGSWGVRVVVSVYGTAAEAPRTDEARGQFCSYVTDLLARNPTVGDVVIWNDPNHGDFWTPQFNADGSSAAPGDYAALLARCWDAAHAARATVNLVAPAASLAAASRRSHDAVTWWRKVGEAYRATGRQLPLFDTVGHVPHGADSSERPWKGHAGSPLVGLGDYSKLVGALAAAFGGTAQPLPGQGPVTIWYLGHGFQTTADPAKARLYNGKETDPAAVPAWSPNAATDKRTGPGPDQATQLADAVRIAYCQPKVSAFFNFHLADESSLTGWQSGVLWADWTPKPSYGAFRRVVRDVTTRNMNCATLSRAGAPPRPAVMPPTVELRISSFRVTSVAPNAVTISWRTTSPARGTVAYGLAESGPTLWKDARGAGLAHEAALGGLTFATPYRIWLTAISDDGQQAHASLDVRTSGVPRSASTSIAGGGGPMLLAGHPFFPMFVWSQCPDGYAANVAAGINVFADNPCGGLQSQLEALAGRGLSAAVAGKDTGSGPGLVGFFYPDEPDGLGLTAADFPPRPSGPSSQVAFLTLTGHFYSWAAPLPWHVDYRAMIAKSDMVGFDIYPLQDWCRPDRLGDVYMSQQELVRLAHPRPTFQWIEVADWSRCPGGPTAVTPATIRAESWLAIAGGAQGLGFFPAQWPARHGPAIASVSRQIAKLGPALLSRQLAADSNQHDVKVGARSFGGAIYVIAVNASYAWRQAAVRVPGLASRVLSVLDEGRQVTSAGDGSIADTFEPLGVHVYIAMPPVTA
jgi:hypothetical protein